MTAHVFGIVHHLDDDSNTALLLFSGCIHHSEIYKVMCSMSPPVGFGKKCPKIVGYKVCISIFIPCYRKYKQSRCISLGITPNLSIMRRAYDAFIVLATVFDSARMYTEKMQLARVTFQGIARESVA